MCLIIVKKKTCFFVFLDSAMTRSKRSTRQSARQAKKPLRVWGPYRLRKEWEKGEWIPAHLNNEWEAQNDVWSSLPVYQSEPSSVPRLTQNERMFLPSPTQNEQMFFPSPTSSMLCERISFQRVSTQLCTRLIQ